MLCVVNLCDWELQVSLTLPRSDTRSKLQLCSLLSDQRSCCFRTSIFLSALLHSLSSLSCLLLSPTPMAYLISLPFAVLPLHSGLTGPSEHCLALSHAEKRRSPHRALPLHGALQNLLRSKRWRLLLTSARWRRSHLGWLETWQ